MYSPSGNTCYERCGGQTSALQEPKEAPNLAQLEQEMMGGIVSKIRAADATHPFSSTPLEEAGNVWKLVRISVAAAETASPGGLLSYQLDKERLRIVHRREGRYLLRTNLLQCHPTRLWELYIQPTQIEEAFRNLKGDLAVRPIYHQPPNRMEGTHFHRLRGVPLPMSEPLSCRVIPNLKRREHVRLAIQDDPLALSALRPNA
jgi:hypothetical protein